MQTSHNKYVHKLTPQEDVQQNEQEKESMEIEQQQNDSINVENERYPYCIVWTSIPLISWLIPCIGHTGICTSEGTIHDFGGPYYIAIDNFSFGRPQKYLMLNDKQETNRQQWDEGVLKADDEFRLQMHNLFTNNCHSHVARALNVMKYKGKESYTMFHIWFMLLVSSRYVRYKYSQLAMEKCFKPIFQQLLSILSQLYSHKLENDYLIK